VSRALGIDEATLADLPRHEESERFSPLEKAALDLAVAMTSSPADVPAELRERLLAELTPGQYAELAAAIAWENHRARLNRALAVREMGFADGGYCVLPETGVGKRTCAAGP
jgi:alkylhydroperoxidase family enzyme